MTELPAAVRESCSDLGLRIGSCEVVRDFPWSYVLRLTTVDGDTIWVKRCGDGMAFEPALTRIIEAVGSPVLVPTLWISGPWIATRHVGGRLGRGEDRTLAAVRRLQQPLAQLQQRLDTRMEEMREIGTPTLGAADVDELSERSIELCARIGHLATRPLLPEEADGLRFAGPALVADLETLERRAPSTLLHLDLHHGNVFEEEGRTQLFDWGDARIGCALVHLVSTISLLGFITDRDTRDPRIEGVVVAYLSMWPDRHGRGHWRDRPRSQDGGLRSAGCADGRSEQRTRQLDRPVRRLAA